MASYLLRRLLLIVPTMLGIMLISFTVVQFAPGGPVERMIAIVTGSDVAATSRFTGAGGDMGTAGRVAADIATGAGSTYRGAQGLDPEFIKELERQFGFDKPVHERFTMMIWDYLRFDFGESYYRNVSVISLIAEKLPVSISLGLWTTFIVYLISIPLGVRKAVRDGTRFDMWTSAFVIVGYAIPGFLFAVLLIVLLAGSTYLDLFPLRGLTSAHWASLSWPSRILDYLWHLVLPVASLVIGSFATITLLSKNSFLDEIGKQYVTTARGKGITEGRVLYGHVFRNAMLIVVSGFPAAFIAAFFTGSLLIETIFSLDGLGLLSFESLVNRDYPVVFASWYIFGLLGLAIRIISDFTYVWIDPRIDFETREA